MNATTIKANDITDYGLSRRESGEFTENDRVCYCFGYTPKQIEQDFLENGRSLILEKIISEKKAGRCDCEKKNPKKR